MGGKSTSVPKGCEELEIKTLSSICTGEKTIGFFDPKTGKLLFAELVKSPRDEEEYRRRYGRA